MNKRQHIIWPGLLALALLLHGVAAQGAAPGLTVVTPLGGQRGTEVTVTVHGNNLEDIAGLVFHEPGFEVLEVTPGDAKKATVKLKIAADTPTGEYGVRVHTRTGISNLRVFCVGNLPEQTEEEPNNERGAAPVVALGTTMNGVITSEDVDYYAVDLAAGARLAVELEGLRIGHVLFDPKLRLFDPQGRELLAEDDTQLFLQDAGFVHVAETEGRYCIAVSEATYGGSGDCHYRLHMGQFPRPFAVLPYGGKPGSQTEVRWLGDPGIGAQTVSLPEGQEGTLRLAVATDTGIAPTGMPFRVTSLDGVAEAEPNEQHDTATPGTAPGAFDGIIGAEGDVDFFAFDGKVNEEYDVRVWARELGSPLDSVVHLYRPNLEAISSADDSVGLDGAFSVKLPEDGRYTLSVRDQLARGGETFAYRVEVTPKSPGMRMGLVENRPVSITVPQDNQSFLLVSASRSGFDSDVTVTLEGLPDGLTATPTVIPQGQAQAPMVIAATPEAPVAAALVGVHGAGMAGETPIDGELDQEVRLVPYKNDTTFYGRQVDRLAVAVSEPAPFKVRMAPPAAPIVHGGGRAITIEVERAEGFTSEIELKFPWLPAGMSAGTAKIPGDQNSTTIRLEADGNTAVGTHQVMVQASAGGYLLCTPFTPVEVQARWVNFALETVETEQGKPLEYKVAVTQAQPFDGEFDAQLVGLPKGVTTEPQHLTKDTAELVFPLTVAGDAPAGKHGSLVVNADIIVSGEPVQHITGGGQLTIFEPLPPELAQAKEEEKPVEAAAAEEPKRKTRFPNS